MSSSTTATTPATRRIAIKSTDWESKLSNVAIDRGHLNRLVMDYLVVEGYKEAAQNFARESGMTTSAAQEADFESIQNRMTIRQAIQQGNIVEAIERVNDLNPEILDKDPSLYFHLQQQRLIELIRQKKIDEALLFAQHELAPRGEEHPEFLNELEQTMTLLAYDVDLPALEAAAAQSAPARSGTAEDTGACQGQGQGQAGEGEGASDGTPPFVAALLHPSHRQATAAQVNAAILTAQSHGPTPKLPNLLRMLAWGETLLGERADFPKLEMHLNGSGGAEKEREKEKDGEKSGAVAVPSAAEDVAMVL